MILKDGTFSQRLESSIRLVRDRFTPRGAYTSRLSKFCSKTSYENLYREGFPAAQQFFHTNLAARRCYWHNNRWFQGLGCSPINAVRELGSERRETVRSISGVGVRALRGPFPSTRGPGRTHLWCTSYRAYGKRWVAKCGEDNC
ncbi:hypothetical protein DAI22_01g360100 [Oryza sativa Japonica Group]|nr:hypothetical protein DAI22_01g360100 [Oryza sativa Japonica Group]